MRKFFIFSILIFPCTLSFSQSVMTPELLWKLGRVSPEIVSPAGNLIYSVRYYDMDANKGESNLYSIPIQGGAAVTFPNKDNIRHHVYSFSATKPLDLKLYSGVPAKPVVFDKPGAVKLGCNIHDWMVGYVYVVDTPYFAKTDKTGSARLDGLPAGDYQLRVWHPYMKTEPAPLPLKLVGSGTENASFRLELSTPQKVSPANK
jgi:hypothetical protein